MSAQLIAKFYESFAKKDIEAMVSCYADDVRFEDPAFGPLVGEDAKNMWRMLAERGADLVVVPSAITDSSAHWDATYTFSATGRKVVNRIDATFVIKDGKIVQHTDRFDFYAWSRQALGVPGLLLGWSPLLKNKVRGEALRGLKKYTEKRAQRA